MLLPAYEIAMRDSTIEDLRSKVESLPTPNQTRTKTVAAGGAGFGRFRACQL